jgi:hypothetical protein
MGKEPGRTPLEEALYQAAKAYEFAPCPYTHAALNAIRRHAKELSIYARPEKDARAGTEHVPRTGSGHSRSTST